MNEALDTTQVLKTTLSSLNQLYGVIKLKQKKEKKETKRERKLYQRIEWN